MRRGNWRERRAEIFHLIRDFQSLCFPRREDIDQRQDDAGCSTDQEDQLIRRRMFAVEGDVFTPLHPPSFLTRRVAARRNDNGCRFD
jgi:hypothetical protein